MTSVGLVVLFILDSFYRSESLRLGFALLQSWAQNYRLLIVSKRGETLTFLTYIPTKLIY